MKVRISADSIRDGAKLDYRKPVDTIDEFDHLLFTIRRFWWHHKKFCVTCGLILVVAVVGVIGGWTASDTKSLCSGGNARTASEYAGYSLRGVHAPAKVATNMLFEKGEYK